MELDVLAQRDPVALGRALQEARRRARCTQEEAARAIGVARTTVVAIEQGARRIRPGELIRLARAYGRDVSDFVRPRPAVEPFAARLQRGRMPLPPGVDVAALAEHVAGFEDRCRDYRELEQITGEPLAQTYPPAYDVSGLPGEQAAESVAAAERNRLGLGDAPLPALRELLEQAVGIRVFLLSVTLRSNIRSA